MDDNKIDIKKVTEFNERIIQKISLLNGLLAKHNMIIDKFSYNEITTVDITIQILPDDCKTK